MKKLKSMLVTLAMLLCCFSASAEEVEIDGLWYNLIAKGGGMAELISSVDGKTYSGDIMVPEIITYDNKPYSVTSIGEKAFYGCRKLNSVTIPNSVTRIGSEAFYDCSALKSATIGYCVTSIGNGAFRNCSSLTSISIPNSVTSIANMAFYNCEKITSVHISDITTWCNIKFSNDYSNPLYYAKHLYINDKEITELIIPEGITSINDYAFCNCIGFTSVTIPQSVKSIGNYAFYFCSNLSSINIPNGVASIGNYAFYRCI